MNVLNLLAEGGTGGIETLCNNIDISSNINNYWCFLNNGGEIAEQIKKRNSDKTFIFNGNKFSIIKIINKINTICKEKKIDILAIHHGGTYCNIIFYYLKKINPNIKFVRFLHSCYEDKYSLNCNFIANKIFLYYFNKALQNADLIISVSKAVQQSHEKKFGLHNIKKVVIYNGIGDQFIEATKKDRSTLKKEKCEIIYIGRLIDVKGIDILIKAISYLKKECYKIHLTIVGAGNEKEKLEQLVKKLKLKAEVDFVGRQSNVIEWLDKADIFVYPSIWEEAFGISVVEAMARGCIPVVFNKGGLTEIIENKKSGFIIDEISEKKLANMIGEIIKKKEVELLKISNNAMERSKIFSIEQTVKKLCQEYTNILNKN